MDFGKFLFERCCACSLGEHTRIEHFHHGIFFGAPQALLGAISIVLGLSIAGWVLYNSFIERQSEYSGGFLTFGIAPALVLFGLYSVRVAFKRFSAPKPATVEDDTC